VAAGVVLDVEQPGRTARHQRAARAKGERERSRPRKAGPAQGLDDEALRAVELDARTLDSRPASRRAQESAIEAARGIVDDIAASFVERPVTDETGHGR